MPRLARRAALLSAVLASLALPAAAATLNTTGTVNGPEIRLGDLFDGIGAKAATAVAPAPAPGSQAVYDAATLARIAGAYGIAWQPAGPGDRVVLARAASVIDAGAIRAAVAQAIAARTGGQRLDITLDNQAMRLYAPAGGPAGLMVENLAIDRLRGRFTAMLQVAGTSQPVPVSGAAVAVVEVPVPTHQIGMGQVIGSADLTQVAVRADRLDQDTALQLALLVGQAARRPLVAGQPILARDVRPPVVVTQNALVTVVLRTASMQITATGRALDNGALGQLIHVMNITSHRTIEGTVVGPNQVSVAVPGRLAMN